MILLLLWALALIFSVTLLLVFTCLLIYTAYIYYVRFRYRKLPHPKWSNYWIANGMEIAQHNKNRHLMFARWGMELAPIYYFASLHMVIVMVVSHEAAKEILTSTKYPKSKFVYRKFNNVFGVRFMGHGLVTNIHHEDWRKRRQALNPAFYKSYLASLIHEHNRSAHKMVECLQQNVGSTESTRLLTVFSKTTTDIISRVAFDFDSQCLDGNVDSLPMKIQECLGAMIAQFYDPTLGWNPWKRGYVERVQCQAREVRELSRSLVIKRMEKLDAGEQTPSDIMNILVNNMRTQYSVEDIIDEVITFFVAGQETTATTLCFMLMLLLKHPHYMSKIVEEIGSVVGNKAEVTVDDVYKMELLDTVMKESLRLYPAVGGTARETTENVVISGKMVPKGTTINVSMFGIHYACYDNPFEFRPERFAKSADESAIPSGAFLPFSLGQRTCIGRDFARIEIGIILTHLLRNFTLTLDDDQTFDVEEQSTIHLIDGLRCFIQEK